MSGKEMPCMQPLAHLAGTIALTGAKACSA
jgi:hypothetical protein